MSQSTYKKTHPRSQYETVAWLAQRVDALVATFTAVYQAERNATATPAAKKLDARTIQFAQSIEYIQILLAPAATVAQYLPPQLQSQIASFMTPKRGVLDPRWIQFDEYASSFVSPVFNPNVGPTVAQYGPAVYAAQQSFRTSSGKVNIALFMDYRESRFGIPYDPALFQGVITSQANTYQTPNKRVQDPRSFQWNQDINFVMAILNTGLLQTLAPVIAQQSNQTYQTPKGKSLSLPLQQWASIDWTFTAANNLIDDLTYPSAQQSWSSFRTVEGKKIGVREQTGDMTQGWMQYVTTLPPTVQPLRPPCDVTWYRNFS